MHDNEYINDAEVGRHESEIAEFRQFQTLTGELVGVNRKICLLLPVEQTEQTAQEKTTRAIQQEVAREVNRFLGIVFQEGRNNAEAALLGVVAQRSPNRRLDWDFANLRIPNGAAKSWCIPPTERTGRFGPLREYSENRAQSL